MLMEIGRVSPVTSGAVAQVEDLSVKHVRSDLAVQTLWNEIVARWGAQAQQAEPLAEEDHGSLGCDFHFPDAQGISHALDIRVDLEGDGEGLSIEDGMWLAEYLRGVGWRTARFAYLIHRGQIAGTFSGWRWAPYRGLNATMDRIHLSISQSVWGAPASIGPEVFDSTNSWGVGTI